MGLFDLFRKEKKKPSQEPDTPLAFAMKISWLVVKAADSRVVMKKLHCKDIEVSNWQNAFTCVYETDRERIFVTPCLDGYVMVQNYDLPLENKEVLQKLAMDFEEVQYFATHRGVGLSCWARYQNGKRSAKLF